MDSLHKRYASPFLYLDELILCEQFSTFIDDFMNRLNDTSLWELYLCRGIEDSFQEWKSSILTNETASKELTKIDVEATIRHAESILNNFEI